MAKHGIKVLRDLYHDSGGLLAHDELGLKFNLRINQMSYNSLIQAIPKKWKEVMASEQNFVTLNTVEPQITVNDKRMGLDSIKSYMLYWHFVNNLQKPPTAIDKWISECLFLNDHDFDIFFELPYKILRDTKMQTFQYKILHKIFPCGAALHIWRVTTNSN